MTTNLPSIRDMLDSYGLSARKSLGQHFLLDMNITRKIVRLSGITHPYHIIEIGPGPGGLTRALLENNHHVTVIERDERFIALLEELRTFYPNQLTIRAENALSTNYLQLMALNKPTAIIANLPYNISTELLIKWLTLPYPSWHQMSLMFQKEVADRILAKVGTKTYGRLSVLSQITSKPTRSFDLPAQAFTPPPKIASTVINFAPVKDPFTHVSALEKVTQHAFSQRRKMVRSSLKSLFGDALEATFEAAGISPTMRAEEIDLVGFQKLATLYQHQLSE